MDAGRGILLSHLSQYTPSAAHASSTQADSWDRHLCVVLAHYALVG